MTVLFLEVSTRVGRKATPLLALKICCQGGRSLLLRWMNYGRHGRYSAWNITATARLVSKLLGDLHTKTIIHVRNKHLPLRSAIPEDITSVRLLSTEMLVEAVAKCLRSIDPETGAGLPVRLSAAMATKYRQASLLAEACKV